MKAFEGKSENIFRLLSESISEGIVIVNSDQQIVASNKIADEMFGYSEGILVGKELNCLVPENVHMHHSGYANTFIKSGEVRRMNQGRDLEGRRKDGTTFPIEVGLNPFIVNDQRFVMALVTDVTLRKKQEKEISDLNHSLEKKIEKRTQELRDTIIELREEVIKRKEAENKTKESLRKERELNELKTKFLSLVSHEFKTPLSGILSSTTLVGKYTQTEQQNNREKHLKTIKSKVKYLNSILNDFLSIERIESGKATYMFVQFPLSKVINEVIYDANMLLKEGQYIKYPHNIDDIIVYFDEKILELTLTNLISNAIKYSPANSTIDVDVEIKGDRLAISVKDQGMGIPKNEQKHIFNRYFRAENALLDQGTGIGLNIVKSHLENIGGTVTFTSKENVGSTFVIEFPITNIS